MCCPWLLSYEDLKTNPIFVFKSAPETMGAEAYTRLVPQTFYPLRRLQKEIAYHILDGDQRLLQVYGDVLQVPKATLGNRDFAVIEGLAKEHLADFLASGIPEYPIR